MQNHYEINVSRRDTDGKYRHYFATSEHSISDTFKAQEIYNALSDKFPSPEFKVDITHYALSGTQLTSSFRKAYLARPKPSTNPLS